MLIASSELPPADGAAWQPQRLPDDWNRSRRSFSGDAWYRIVFQLEPQQLRLMAIYVPRVSLVGQPFVNGTPLTTGSRFEEPLTRLWYRPQYYLVPVQLLQAGRNVLHYRVRAYPGSHGGLSQLYIGEPQDLSSLWSRHVLRQVTAMQVTTGIAAALGVLVLAAWAVLWRNSAYGWFGVAAVAWTLHCVLVLAVQIPVSTLLWEVLNGAALAWVVVALMMFALRLAGLTRPVVEHAALAYAASVPVLLWFAGVAHVTRVASVLLLVPIAVGVYESRILATVARRTRLVESLLLFGAAVLVAALGLRDWLGRSGANGYAEPLDLHYGMLALFMAVFWSLLGQAAASRRAAERLNLQLEARVRAKSAELERSHSELRDAHAAEALATERERIMRDMHDGIGSQLMTARELATHGELESAQVAALLDECLDDLRLMIDSLEPTDGDLSAVLGNLRYRLNGRLVRQGIALRWEMDDLSAETGFAPRVILQVLRIAQEAVSNALKHAGASEIAVIAGMHGAGSGLHLSIRDNGRGIPEARSAAGRGLANMYQRAAAIGGTLDIRNGSPGCTVTLTVPTPSRHTIARRGDAPPGVPHDPR